ncbi:hypothetical protein GYB22_00590 [bacterium]|nr:hypothetical protein [bacterium]
MNREVAIVIAQSLLALILFIGIAKKAKPKIDQLILVLVSIVFITEIFGLWVFPKFNVNIYRSFMIVEMIILSIIFYKDTFVKTPYILAIGTISAESLTQIFSDYSILSVLTDSLEVEDWRISESIQFFDLASLNGFIITVLTFHWIWNLVNKSEHNPRLRNKKLIYAFSFLIFFGGSFFTIAFSRLLLAETFQWQQIWYNVYIPIYFLYYTGILIGLLWKTSPPSSS